MLKHEKWFHIAEIDYIYIISMDIKERGIRYLILMDGVAKFSDVLATTFQL